MLKARLVHATTALDAADLVKVVYAPSVDLDGDSDNTTPFTSYPDPANLDLEQDEDDLEDSSPVRIDINWGDHDSDMVPGFADGINLFGYKKWIMHGTFKHWDKKGQLIGWYKFINGKGVRRQYHSNGQLHREVSFNFNRRHGPIRLFYNNGQISAITQQRYGEPCGMEIAFWPNGKFQSRNWSDCSSGHLQLLVSNEPGLNFMGPLRLTVKYYVKGSKVSKKQYLAAVAKDASLPKPFDDPENFRILSEREKRIIEHYKKIKRVKIPLRAPTDNTLPFDISEKRK